MRDRNVTSGIDAFELSCDEKDGHKEPGVAAIIRTQSGYTPALTGTQMNQFFEAFPVKGVSKGTGYCFARPLTV